MAVKPGVEEVQSFQNIINQSRPQAALGQPSQTRNDDNSDQSGGDDDIHGDQLIRKTFLLEGCTTEICKGDKIKIVKGDLNGIEAIVTGLERE
jgi:hypothetical protein